MEKALLPKLEKNVNHSPHVVILGAGASAASFPKGDKRGLGLPSSVAELFAKRTDLVPALLLFRSASKKGISKNALARISEDTVAEFSKSGVITGLRGGRYFVLTSVGKQYLASLRT
jgi:hypothetical protein